MSEPNAIVQLASGVVFEVAESAGQLDALIRDAEKDGAEFIAVTETDGEIQRVNRHLIQRYRDKVGRSGPNFP